MSLYSQLWIQIVAIAVLTTPTYLSPRKVLQPLHTVNLESHLVICRSFHDEQILR